MLIFGKGVLVFCRKVLVREVIGGVEVGLWEIVQGSCMWGWGMVEQVSILGFSFFSCQMIGLDEIFLGLRLVLLFFRVVRGVYRWGQICRFGFLLFYGQRNIRGKRVFEKGRVGYWYLGLRSRGFVFRVSSGVGQRIDLLEGLWVFEGI